MSQGTMRPEDLAEAREFLERYVDTGVRCARVDLVVQLLADFGARRCASCKSLGVATPSAPAAGSHAPAAGDGGTSIAAVIAVAGVAQALSYSLEASLLFGAGVGALVFACCVFAAAWGAAGAWLFGRRR